MASKQVKKDINDLEEILRKMEKYCISSHVSTTYVTDALVSLRKLEADICEEKISDLEKRVSKLEQKK